MVFQGEANLLSYLALILSAPAAMLAYALLRPATATTVVMLGAVLFLPVGIQFDAPGMPALDRNTLPPLYALVGCLIYARPQLARVQFGRGIEACAVLLLAGTVITPLLNQDPVVVGPRLLAPLGPYDSLSAVLQNGLFYVVPFFLGRALIRSHRDLQDLLELLVLGALVYSVLILIEIRLSPQLNRWVYGYHQMDFQMTLRLGGYRPMVFMRSGLEVAMFVLVAALAATALGRAGGRLLTIPLRWIAVWLFVVLVLCKSLGAIVYGLVLVPLLLLLPSRVLARVAAVLALLIFATPILRAFDWAPTEPLVEFFGGVDQERADSLGGRFANEDALLDRAWQRAWFGWGGNARNRIYNVETGDDLSVTDGYWVIQIGTAGIVGFAAVFGLLLLPVAHAALRISRLPAPDQHLVAGFALLVTVLTLDLIPNGFLSIFSLYLSGALTGAVAGIESAHAAAARTRRKRPAATPDAAAPPREPVPVLRPAASKDLLGPSRS